jgi:hypothetical protein
MTSHKFVEQRDYFDEYIEYGLKTGITHQPANGLRRAALLRAARLPMHLAAISDRHSMWVRFRQFLAARPIQPAPDPLEVFGFAWIWALHLTVTPLRSLR